MDWKLELLVLPVSDVDRAKTFYAEQLGFTLDVDHRAGDSFRVVQMTPPGSACSVTFGTGLGSPDSGPVHGMHLIVNDIDVARAHLVDHGVEIDDVHHFENGNRAPGPDPERSDYNSFLSFSDPDGNSWVVQEVGHASR